MSIIGTLALLSLLATATGVVGHEESEYYSDKNLTAARKIAIENAPWLEEVSDRELDAYLKNYEIDLNSIGNLYGLFGDTVGYDASSMLSDLKALGQFSDDMPTAPDLDAIRDEAYAAVDAENDEILGMYDADKARVTDLYNQQLADNNAAYNRNVDQILSNDYQKNAQLLGTMRSEMNRSQRNALESGASAGLRIAGNINTMLSMQNKQSQQSLETSNNLAQMLLNQQQANAGLRSEYSGYLSQDTANRAALKSGTAERKENMFNMYRDRADATYDRQVQDYENKYSATVGATNPFADANRARLYKSQYNK